MKILIFILLAAWILAYAAGIGVFIGDDRYIKHRGKPNL